MARKSGTLAGRLALGAGALALAAAAPSAVLATGLLGTGLLSADSLSDDSARGAFSTFTPASADPRMAELLAQSRGSQTQMMRFTPAGATATRTNRSVTVAVRVDQEVAQAISGRSGIERDSEEKAAASTLRIAATRYNLGVARGYSSFSQPVGGRPTLSADLSDITIPDLSEFKPSEGVQRDPSRFAARIALDENRPALTTGGEAIERSGDQLLDVGGSYRLTRNLDVTAGVRYRQDRDLSPLPELEQQDSQAVYIGTQFRF